MTRMRAPMALALLQFQREAAALARLAFEFDAPAQQRRQLLRQVQSEPGALVPARAGGAQLLESLEQLGLVLRDDPDAGVHHAETRAQHAVVARLRQLDLHRPAV